MTRQEANIKIAEKLLEICKSEDGKHLRFHQLLFNLGINEFSEGTKNSMKKISFNKHTTTFKDKYNQESVETLKEISSLSLISKIPEIHKEILLFARTKTKDEVLKAYPTYAEFIGTIRDF